MKYPFDVDGESSLIERPDNAPQDLNNIVYTHDKQIRNLAIKLLQIETRLNSLENLVNAMHEHIRVWYDS